MATVAQKWMERGLLKGRREDILTLLEMRLQPKREWLDRIARQLEGIEDIARLHTLLLTAAQVSSPEEFEARLAQE